MKVVLLNTAERHGGAAVAANRLLKALSAVPGMEVTMLVRDKATDDPQVVSVNTTACKREQNKLRFAWERAMIFFANKFNRRGLFQVSIANTGTDVSQLPVVREADIIHLHWINQGFLSLRDLRKLQRLGKPIVWTLHDLWPATGICHYPDTCTRYRTQCDACPQMAATPLLPLSRRVFKQKMRLDFSHTAFVGCSRWITDRAQTSGLLRQAGFHAIPNPIDGAVFHPIDRGEARQRFLLPTDRPIVLFAAAKVSDTRKGIKYLIEACQLLYRQGLPSFDVALLGGQPEGLAASFPCRVHSLGYLSAPEDIRAAYASATVFVIPSLEDNLPNTVMEALACGTPCVGFRTGGIPEMIDHLQNGYIARYQDAQDLANGIAWVLNHPEPKALSNACVQKVNQCYRPEIVARQYQTLYETLLRK
ncbi:MAG: glycosyltransferase family 4 protein [Bacteroidales bacterium]|nr:glycosyltransferase family 4 protein [Bacteroidales bacterium]